MSKKDKRKAELLLSTFDAHLFSAGYTPECQGKSRCVFLLSELWDEDKQQHISAHLEFRDVAAVEWVLNVPQDGIGSDVGGLYELFGKKEKIALLERVFQRRKAMWLLSGDYDYDEDDPYDSLNSREDLDELEEKKNLKQYRLFLLQKQGGGALILAKRYELREIPEECIRNP
jgi:hypothetical protein